MKNFTVNDIDYAGCFPEGPDSMRIIFVFTNPDVTDLDSYYDDDGQTDWSAVLEVVYNYKTQRVTSSQVVYVDPDNVSDDEYSVDLTSSELDAVYSSFGSAFGKPLEDVIGIKGENHPKFS